uniref:Uncharacterized protein n=1 Tax=Romanomermis culicivorax TaxID=13658 RepID=A0A915IXM5_ROMCU
MVQWSTHMAAFPPSNLLRRPTPRQ